MRTKAMQRHNCSWARWTKRGKAYRGTTRGRRSAIVKLPNREMPRPSFVWARCMTAGWASHKTKRKRQICTENRRVRGMPKRLLRWRPKPQLLRKVLQSKSRPRLLLNPYPDHYPRQLLRPAEPLFPYRSLCRPLLRNLHWPHRPNLSRNPRPLLSPAQSRRQQRFPNT